MDGENNGKPYFLMDDLGVKPPIFGNTQICPKSPIFQMNPKKVSFSRKEEG